MKKLHHAICRICYQCWGNCKVIGANGEWKKCPTCKGKGEIG